MLSSCQAWVERVASKCSLILFLITPRSSVCRSISRWISCSARLTSSLNRQISSCWAFRTPVLISVGHERVWNLNNYNSMANLPLISFNSIVNWCGPDEIEVFFQLFCSPTFTFSTCWSRSSVRVVHSASVFSLLANSRPMRTFELVSRLPICCTICELRFLVSPSLR